jgi:regulatory protein
MANKSKDPYWVAQAILSRRDHSEFEVRTKMKRKSFSVQQIDDALEKLKKLNLINDNNFAVMFVEYTLKMRAVGPKWLSHKLKQKGIESSVISSVLDEAYSFGRENELAKEAATKWRRTHQKHADDRERLTRYLLARGFSFNTISSIDD